MFKKNRPVNLGTKSEKGEIEYKKYFYSTRLLKSCQFMSHDLSIKLI